MVTDAALPSAWQAVGQVLDCGHQHIQALTLQQRYTFVLCPAVPVTAWVLAPF